MTKEQLMLEYVKCMKDTPYALRTYLQTYDNTVSKYVPLELFPDQISLLDDYENFNENIALKYRQAGVSTVTAAWVSKKVAFAKKTKPEKILIIANKLDTSQEMANKIRAFITQWPDWVGVGFSVEKDSQKHYKLNNGCEVKAVATSKDALRGFTPTILIFDEAAFIDADSDFWAACMASLSTGGKVIVVSTPNGYDPIYYEIYDQALRNMNDFKISEMYWFRDPRYTRDLYLVKTKDIIHYLLNKEEYSKDDIISWESISFDDRN
jgi:phage terminase large subunit-like protein